MLNMGTFGGETSPGGYLNELSALTMKKSQTKIKGVTGLTVSPLMDLIAATRLGGADNIPPNLGRSSSHARAFWQMPCKQV